MYVVLDLFQCWIQYCVGFIFLLYCKLYDFFKCIHVDVCLRNVNQYQKKIVIINATNTCIENYPLSYSSKQLIKIQGPCLQKLYSCFSLSMVSEVTICENSKQTLPQVEKITVQKLVIGFCTVASNHQVKYLASANLTFLIKNMNLSKVKLSNKAICSDVIIYFRRVFVQYLMPILMTCI